MCITIKRLFREILINFWIRNWSHIAIHLVVVVSCSPSCWCDRLQKSQGSVVSTWIGMKFGRNVLRVNMHWLTESDFWYDVILSGKWSQCPPACCCCKLPVSLLSACNIIGSLNAFSSWSTIHVHFTETVYIRQARKWHGDFGNMIHLWFIT